MKLKNFFFAAFVAAFAFASCEQADPNGGTNGDSGNGGNNSPEVLLDVDLSDNMGGFTVNDVTKPSELTNIWTYDSSNKYLKATAYKSSVNYESESWLISPEIDLTGVSAAFLAFEHTGNYFESNKEQQEAQVMISESTNEPEWSALTVSYWTKGWEWAANEVDLSSWAGKKIKVAFKYSSTATKAGTWEVRKIKFATGKAQTVSFEQALYNATIGSDFVSPVVQGAKTTVTYSSSNPQVATVDSNTGTVTVLAEGETVISASAAAAGEYLAAEASYTLKVFQAGAQPLTIVLSAATKPCDSFPDTSAGVTTLTSYTIDGYQWTFCPSSGNKFSWYSSDKYILWGKKDAYILMPAVEGKKLESVTILTGKNASTSVQVGVYTADGKNPVAGGAAITLNAKDTEFTWMLSETENNTSYQLRVVSAHNAQLQTLTLLYR